VDATTDREMTSPSLYADKPAGYFDLVREDVLALIPRGTRRLLDVGCGTGATARAAKDRLEIAEAWGIEGTERASQVAGPRLDRVLSGDVETCTVPAPDGYFDCILCADILEHTRDPWAVLRELRRLLDPKGVLVVSLPNLRHLRPLWSLVADRFEYEESGILDRSHLRFFTLHTMREMLAETGYEILRRSENRSRNRLYDALVVCSLGLLKPFTVYQYLFVARPVRSSPGPGGRR